MKLCFVNIFSMFIYTFFFCLQAEAKFVELNEAFEVLKDAELRERYNRLGREGLAEQRKGGNRHDHHDYRYFKEDFGLYDDDEQIETYEGFTFWEMHESDQVVMVSQHPTQPLVIFSYIVILI